MVRSKGGRLPFSDEEQGRQMRGAEAKRLLSSEAGVGLKP